MKDLADLLARVEKATGPDRELGFAIWKALFARAYSGTLTQSFGVGVVQQDAHDPTASLDAALALVERVLPGWTVLLDIPAGLRCTAVVGLPPEGGEEHAGGKTPPLALLAALLKAKIAQSQDSQPLEGE